MLLGWLDHWPVPWATGFGLVAQCSCVDLFHSLMLSEGQPFVAPQIRLNFGHWWKIKG